MTELTARADDGLDPPLRVKTHPGLCAGWGNCHRFAPDVYPLDDQGHVAVHLMEVAAEHADDARLGALSCPASAITVIEPHHRDDPRHPSSRRHTAPSAFLTNARARLDPDNTADVCPSCGYDFTIEIGPAIDLLEQMLDRYDSLLHHRDSNVVPADGGWTASAFLWHLADLARRWSERWAHLAAAPGGRLPGWEPDATTDARSFRALPATAAMRALRAATHGLIDATRALDPLLPFEHETWGPGHVTDGMRWVAHEYVHHLDDVEARSIEIDIAT